MLDKLLALYGHPHTFHAIHKLVNHETFIVSHYSVFSTLFPPSNTNIVPFFQQRNFTLLKGVSHSRTNSWINLLASKKELSTTTSLNSIDCLLICSKRISWSAHSCSRCLLSIIFMLWPFDSLITTSAW